MCSKIRQNYHEECEALINKQINMEFYASYVYLSMSSFFNRDDQALHGFASFFQKSSEEERQHGIKLMEYQTKRGGKVVFQDIAKPSSSEWGNPLQAMEAALELEKTVGSSSLLTHSFTFHLFRSTRVSWTCTRLAMAKETLISVTSLRLSTLENKLMGSRRLGT